MSLREDLAETIRINLTHLLDDTLSPVVNAHIQNTVDDIIADLTIHGLYKE